jgi:hypothetical protein
MLKHINHVKEGGESSWSRDTSKPQLTVKEGVGKLTTVAGLYVYCSNTYGDSDIACCSLNHASRCSWPASWSKRPKGKTNYKIRCRTDDDDDGRQASTFWCERWTRDEENIR